MRKRKYKNGDWRLTPLGRHVVASFVAVFFNATKFVVAVNVGLNYVALWTMINLICSMLVVMIIRDFLLQGIGGEIISHRHRLAIMYLQYTYAAPILIFHIVWENVFSNSDLIERVGQEDQNHE